MKASRIFSVTILLTLLSIMFFCCDLFMPPEAGDDGEFVCIDNDMDGRGEFCVAGPDCNDADASVYPGAPERGCDGLDNNCNGEIDEIEAVQFEDDDFREYVSMYYAIVDSDTVYNTDLCGYMELQIFPMPISPWEIGGIEYIYNLELLYMTQSNISNISPIAALDKLKILYMYLNNISDIFALGRLKNLEYLLIQFEPVKNISPLSGLSKLGTIYILFTGIERIPPLRDMSSLEVLYMPLNKISEISDELDMPSINQLILAYNDITDISSLCGLESLVELDLFYNSISDVSCLYELSNLDQLNIAGNQISDIQSLVDNPGLASGDSVLVSENPLSEAACCDQIPALLDRGVLVDYGSACDPYPGCPPSP